MKETENNEYRYTLGNEKQHREANPMAKELILQLATLILTLSILYLIHNLRKKQPSRLSLRNKTRETHKSNHHLTQSSRHLARARCNSNNEPQSKTHAKNALIEASQALSLSQRDPKAHILKSHALHLMGHRTAAMRSMDYALSKACVRRLTKEELVEALVKRGEMKMKVNRRRRVESAVEDLVEAVRLSEGKVDSVVFCLLGECYEWMGMKEMAMDAFQRALEIEPDSVRASSGLVRLGP